MFRLVSLPFSGKRMIYNQFRMITGFLPGNLDLYELAVTHKSSCITLPDGTSVNNERLEYLGDAILNAIIADYLYLQFPESDEGFLTQLRSKKAKKFVIEKILDKHLDLERLARKESDFKSRIIEWAQKNKMEISFLNQESNNGNHETVFTSRVVLYDEELGSGSGYSKKDAEQRAAEEALEKITH